MNLQNKKKKLSIRVVIHPCKASAAGVYSLAIRVLYCRKKKEYSLGWRVHESNYRRDADRVVYSSEGILTRREVSLVNRLIRNEKEDLVRNYRLLERSDPGFTLERLMLKHRKEQYDQSVDKFILQYIDTLLEEGKQSTAASYTSGLYSLLRFCSLRKINFKDIDYVFVTDYIHYLRMRGISENSIHMYLSNFRAVYNKARKQGIRVCGEKSLCRAERAQAGNGETGVEQGRDSAHRFGRPAAVSPVGSGARPVHVQFLLPGHVLRRCNPPQARRHCARHDILHPQQNRATVADRTAARHEGDY